MVCKNNSFNYLVQFQQSIYTQLNSHEDQLRKNIDQINTLEKILKNWETKEQDREKVLAAETAKTNEENAKKLKELTAKNTELQNSVSNLQTAAWGIGIFAGASAIRRIILAYTSSR